MKKKIIAFALVLLLLTGCAAHRGATLLHAGAPVSVETLLWIDSSPISLDLYRYYFCTTRAAFDGGDSSYWKTHLSEEPSLLSQTLEALRAAVALERFAGARGLSLSEEEEKSVEDSLKKARKAAGGESAFLLSLEKSYLTEEVYRGLLRQSVLREKLEKALFAEGGEFFVADEDFSKIVRSEFLCLRQITLSASAVSRKTMEALAARAAKGEDFSVLIREALGEDASTDPLLVGRGYLVEDFETAARALEPGQVSGVVESAYGLHLIQRLPLPEDRIGSEFSALKEEYCTNRFSLALSDLADSFSVEFSPEYSYVGVETLN